ncbi:hypothetical protein J6590_092872 [Homalodisca vitripennis]|nr:hypothetical protein J6590_092872 [Homalodisca vitripennis]
MLSSAQGTIDVPPSCLRCLCEAVSGGPSCVYGAVSSCHDGVCGPYAITLPYWQDAGRPTVGLEDRLSDVSVLYSVRDKVSESDFGVQHKSKSFDLYTDCQTPSTQYNPHVTLVKGLY